MAHQLIRCCHSAIPCRALIFSKLSSPVKEMRNIRTPARLASGRHERERVISKRNRTSCRFQYLAGIRAGYGGNRPFFGNTSQIDFKFRPFGLKPFFHPAKTLAAPPVVVVMWKWFSPSLVVTPSSMTMPSSLSISPYRQRPTFSVENILVYRRSRNSAASCREYQFSQSRGIKDTA